MQDQEEPIEPVEPEMMEVELPITWLEWFSKLVLMGTFLFLGLLFSIYVGQEGMLYVCDQPIKFVE